jgi:hypothetical protein
MLTMRWGGASKLCASEQLVIVTAAVNGSTEVVPGPGSPREQAAAISTATAAVSNPDLRNNGRCM